MLYDQLQQAVALRNEHGTHDPETGKQIAPGYRLESGPIRSGHGRTAVESVRSHTHRRDLYAFRRNPRGRAADCLPTAQPAVMTFYAENTTLSDVKRWFDQTLTNAFRRDGCNRPASIRKL